MKLPSGIRAVVFDAVGTVLHPVRGAPAIYAEAAARYGLNISPEEVLTRFRHAYLVQEEIDRLNNWKTDEAREVLRWQAIVAETLPGSPPECFEELYQHFAKPEAWAAPEDAKQTFRTLAARYRLGLGSNYDRRLLEVLAGRPELELLAPRIVISSVVGVRKPGQAFFDAVVNKLQWRPGSIAFVGDDVDNDYVGAFNAGMFPILLDSKDRFPEYANRIRTLSELAPVAKRWWL